MAIFGFKKRKDEKLEQGAEAAKAVADKKSPAKGAKKQKAAVQSGSKTKAVAVPKLKVVEETVAASVVIRPRVTEKSGLLSQSNVYTFEVNKDANKASVAKAIKAIYKVTPVKVAMINTPMKNVFVKGKKGTVAGMRKALVTVKAGEKIDFV
ncbi:MAG: 50S ribosomal protein L23 [Patescibacteria group bacterium]|nr:50S ribosomal protein L23 [Patescibacteria group bacterium]MDE1941271.1 50S ribosomal protein L23 [Patescibacteria group bacterium]MDE1966505.1 50S ribosomal protein L23 [Patescibacteria group bacterium]